MAQFKLIIRLRKQYMIDCIFKYRIGNLIILYCYICFELLGTIVDIIWNSMKLMGNAGFGS